VLLLIRCCCCNYSVPLKPPVELAQYAPAHVRQVAYCCGRQLVGLIADNSASDAVILKRTVNNVSMAVRTHMRIKLAAWATTR